MSQCLFCRIVEGEIPSSVVQENDRFYAFRDIDPKAPVHVLAIPREHVESLNQVTGPDQAGGLLLFVRDVARGLGLADKGYRVVLNTNADGGQTVFHLHAHILGGRAMHWPPG